MKKTLITIENDGLGASIFSKREIDLHGDRARLLSDQISAVNFRLRSSDSSYESSWHVAGDPTLLVILSGVMRIELRSGEVTEFAAGDLFIAKDYLETGVKFDNKLHGHRAEIVGLEPLEALHLKLEKRSP